MVCEYRNLSGAVFWSLLSKKPDSCIASHAVMAIRIIQARRNDGFLEIHTSVFLYRYWCFRPTGVIPVSLLVLPSFCARGMRIPESLWSSLLEFTIKKPDSCIASHAVMAIRISQARRNDGFLEIHTSVFLCRYWCFRPTGVIPVSLLVLLSFCARGMRIPESLRSSHPEFTVEKARFLHRIMCSDGNKHSPSSQE